MVAVIITLYRGGGGAMHTCGCNITSYLIKGSTFSNNLASTCIVLEAEDFNQNVLFTMQR